MRSQTSLITFITLALTLATNAIPVAFLRDTANNLNAPDIVVQTGSSSNVDPLTHFSTREAPILSSTINNLSAVDTPPSHNPNSFAHDHKTVTPNPPPPPNGQQRQVQPASAQSRSKVSQFFHTPGGKVLGGVLGTAAVVTGLGVGLDEWKKSQESGDDDGGSEEPAAGGSVVKRGWLLLKARTIWSEI